MDCSWMPRKTRLLITGEEIELHQVMLAAQKAELALELTLTVRNKVVEAYQKSCVCRFKAVRWQAWSCGFGSWALN